MTWNIAQAKQQFSEVVRLSVQEPQAIYNRDKPVAMLVNATEFEAFDLWRRVQRVPTLTQQLDEGRAVLHEAGVGAIPVPARDAVQRPNAFVQMLQEEGLLANDESPMG